MISEPFRDLRDCLHRIEAEDNGFNHVLNLCKHSRLGGSQFFFIGNGGSAAIASHMAADWMKNGDCKSLAFNDGPQLTCLSNDLGYDNVFSVPLDKFAHFGDVLFAISSSGESQNIIKAVDIANHLRLNVITLSGFAPDNILRTKGMVNFYVPSMKYGTVEISHLAILHALLDELSLEKPNA